jgi:ATP-binding cassette subfamily F protein 3
LFARPLAPKEKQALLTVSNISKRYGDDLVLSGVSFTLGAGERAGLVGPNGGGKTTLMRIVAGLESPDGGSVARTPPGLAQGYLPQAWEGAPGATVADTLRDSQGDLGTVQAELAELEGRMATPGLAAEELEGLLERYGAAQERFDALGGYDWEHRAAGVREGLGLAELPADMPVALLSGGQKTRLGLARLLLRRPSLLLLDEPTNHLDTDAVEWLEQFIAGYDGAVLLISHDRAFLDATVSRVLELRPLENERPAAQLKSSVGSFAVGGAPQLRSYAGTYSDYAAAKEHERALHEQQWQNQQSYIAGVEGDIARLKGQALGVELSTTSAQPTVRRYAKKVAKKAKSRERKLERYMDSDERVAKPQQGWGMKLDFAREVDGARVVLRVADLSFRYPPLPGAEGAGAELLRDVTFELAYGERVALVGPNGTGKTTLLRLITGRLQSGSGSLRLGSGVKVGYLSQEQENLDPRRSVLDTLRAVVPWGETECRNWLHRYLFAADEVFRPVGACSFGERARLGLALLVAQGCTFLVLDEPVNHLDIPARERFEAALDTFGGTILAVAHDRYFLSRFAERVLALRGGTLSDFPGSYEEYEDYSESV